MGSGARVSLRPSSECTSFCRVLVFIKGLILINSLACLFPMLSAEEPSSSAESKLTFTNKSGEVRSESC